MNKLLSVVAALAAALTVAACGAPVTSPDPASTGVADSAPTGTAATTPSAPSGTPAPPATEDAPSGAASSEPDAKPAAPVAVDQSTPESAMTSWLTAMLEGDGTTVCGLMASGETAIADLPAAQGQCAEMIAPMLEQLSSVKAMFGGLKITGATISGDTADFASATTKPALAAEIIASLKAVRLDGKWYVTEG